MIKKGRFLFLLLGTAGCESGVFVPENGIFLSRIQAGLDFTCALDRDGVVTCWGGNGQGQLGIGPDRSQIVPVPVVSDERFISLSTKAFGEHVCGVSDGGVAHCWGDNNFGQLGNGTTTDRDVPTPVMGGLDFRSVTAGWRFSCALTVDDDAYCWGRGEWGQLGDGLAVNSSTPVAVTGGHKFLQIEVGSNNLVCGLTRDGYVLCWGLDFFGSLGAPTTETCTRSDGLELACAKIPQPISANLGFTAISVGNSYGCAIDTAGDGWCWGANGAGQLGAPATATCPDLTGAGQQPCNPAPTLIEGGLTFTAISTSVAHSCGISTDGAGYCWGMNGFGQRGDGQFGNTGSTPTPVAGGLNFVGISAGANHTCGETLGGALWCWGANDVGQLGTGNNNLELGPAAVVQ